MSGAIGANPKLAACATELAVDFKRNWRRKALDLGVGDPEPPGEVVAATLYSLLYSGTILCPKPEHRIGISAGRNAALTFVTDIADDIDAGRHMKPGYLPRMLQHVADEVLEAAMPHLRQGPADIPEPGDEQDGQP